MGLLRDLQRPYCLVAANLEDSQYCVQCLIELTSAGTSGPDPGHILACSSIMPYPWPWKSCAHAVEFVQSLSPQPLRSPRIVKEKRTSILRFASHHGQWGTFNCKDSGLGDSVLKEDRSTSDSYVQGNVAWYTCAVCGVRSAECVYGNTSRLGGSHSMHTYE